MEFYATRLAAAAGQRTAPGPAWVRVEQGASVWAPPGGGERRSLLPPRPPLHSAAAGRRGEARAEWRGGTVRDQREAGAGPGGSARRGEGGGVDGRGKAEQEVRGGGVPRRGAAVARAEAGGEGSAGGALGVPFFMVAREGGQVGIGTKRPPPPPKRPAVSARRQFPTGCGRDAAALLGRADGGSRFGAARADDILHALDKAAAAPRPPLALAGCNAVALPGTESLSSASASGGLNKVSATDGAAPVARGGHHVPAARMLAKHRIVSANRSFPPGCGRDAVPLLAVEMRLMLAATRGPKKSQRSYMMGYIMWWLAGAKVNQAQKYLSTGFI